MQPSEIRAARTLVTALAAIGVLGCGRTEHQKADSGNVASTLVAPPQPGTLAKPVDQYTGDELYAFTRRLNFTGGTEHQRRCRGRAECRGPAAVQSTRLRVDAVDLEDSLVARSMSANGVIAARAINRGSVADTMYGMRPGPYEYFLIALPAAGLAGTATWRLEELTTTAGSRAHQTVMRGKFTECNHPYRRGARADFKSCATAAPTPIRPASFSLQDNGREEPIWIGCGAGCCTADPPGGQ